MDEICWLDAEPRCEAENALVGQIPFAALHLAEAKHGLLGLKPDERTAIILKAAGYSYEEIAEQRGWTYTKVNRCLAEGRASLRASISLT